MYGLTKNHIVELIIAFFGKKIKIFVIIAIKLFKHQKKNVFYINLRAKNIDKAKTF